MLQETTAWNGLQVKEAMSETNLHFFRVNNHRDPYSIEEAVMWYIKHGGAADFAKNHAHEAEKLQHEKITIDIPVAFTHNAA